MDDTIVSKDHIRAKARRAFNEGKGRDDHGMNAGAAAIDTWQQEWDKCSQAARRASASANDRFAQLAAGNLV